MMTIESTIADESRPVEFQRLQILGGAGPLEVQAAEQAVFDFPLLHVIPAAAAMASLIHAAWLR